MQHHEPTILPNLEEMNFVKPWRNKVEILFHPILKHKTLLHWNLNKHVKVVGSLNDGINKVFKSKFKSSKLASPTITSQFLTTSSQVNVQPKTQLNGRTSTSSWGRGWNGNKAGHNANDGESTNPWQRHGN